MFKLLRYYSVASLIAVLATTMLLVWFYRQVAVHGIVQLAETNNLTLARTALNSVRPALVDYLKQAARVDADSIGQHTPPPELTTAIMNLMRDSTVVRIKLYNRDGMVVYSTKSMQIGRDQRGNPGFIAAINGGVGNALIYRDTFNRFDGATEEDNLMQTYIPVRASPTEPVHGVFEIYTDVNGLVRQNELTGFIIMAGALFILMGLYAALLLVVQRARNIIYTQTQTIRERTETLEILSSHMLKNEESHKQKIAFDLHEGLAQTLAAVKLQVESGQHCRDCKNDKTATGSLESVIPLLQDAIQEVRTIATDLRPPSLDDLGLLLTLNGFFREFEQQHPDTRIERKISLQERDIPAPLKAILYRIIASVCDDMSRHMSTEQIHIALWLDQRTLTLMIDDMAAEALDRTAIPLARIDPQLRAGFARMEELTILSGGEFAASHHTDGGSMLRATWSR